MMPPTGRILHLQRLSTEDGPGIRTTVFFKGCPLRCSWCHNPESLSAKPQTQWFATRCLGCDTCLSVCPDHNLTRTESGVNIDRDHCKGCGKCADACPAGALELLGQKISVDELLVELSKDRAYYDASGGGVTLSGGEPTLQADFAEALLRGLKAEGIVTALDTCGQCPPLTLDRLLPFTDLVMYDLKLYDDDLHRQFTGTSNRLILDNLLHLLDIQRSQTWPFKLWIRTPLIPGVTATRDNLTALGFYLNDELTEGVERWELCAFNNLCCDQYTRLGLEWAYAQTPLMTSAELAACEEIAKTTFSHPKIVHATGATRQVAPP
jgi:pyruvate formate lyase activating enzyme